MILLLFWVILVISWILYLPLSWITFLFARIPLQILFPRKYVWAVNFQIWIPAYLKMTILPSHISLIVFLGGEFFAQIVVFPNLYCWEGWFQSYLYVFYFFLSESVIKQIFIQFLFYASSVLDIGIHWWTEELMSQFSKRLLYFSGRGGL